MEVYSAGEKPLVQADGKALLQAVCQSGMSVVHYVPVGDGGFAAVGGFSARR